MYEVIPDPQAEKDELLRVIDESDEHCLFLAGHIVSIELPAEVERALVAP